MRNEVIYDKNGRPDIMVVFTPSELGLPDTLRGRKVKEYAISKYPNTLIDGVPYSLPFMKPAVNISHDEAIRLCESKGEGWHLITNDEWVALGLWSWDNDTMPTGNTASGKSHSHPEQTGTTYDGGCGKTLTGSGPVQWNHDGPVLLVAHNAQFDLLFTSEMLQRHGNGGLEAQNAADYLDSLTVYKDRRAYPHKLANAILTYKLEDKVQNSHRAIDDVAALFEVCKAMDAERSDLLSYVNVFGYNPKYGVSGKRIEKVAYWPQNFNKYMQAPSYTLPAKLRQRRR